MATFAPRHANTQANPPRLLFFISSSGSRVNLGIALAGQGKLTEAVEHYARALQLNPEDFKAYNNLGIALARQGKFAGAIQHFQQALNLATIQGNSWLAEAIRHQIESCQGALPQPPTNRPLGFP